MLVEVESTYIQDTLLRHEYNITKTAYSLGISRQCLQYRLRKFNINATR
ncbi:helix-turn-helix domain-containing protein [Halalkalibacter flavus]